MIFALVISLGTACDCVLQVVVLEAVHIVIKRRHSNDKVTPTSLLSLSVLGTARNLLQENNETKGPKPKGMQEKNLSYPGGGDRKYVPWNHRLTSHCKSRNAKR